MGMTMFAVAARNPKRLRLRFTPSLPPSPTSTAPAAATAATGLPLDGRGVLVPATGGSATPVTRVMVVVEDGSGAAAPAGTRRALPGAPGGPGPGWVAGVRLRSAVARRPAGARGRRA